jgi:hypothetical protein
MRSKDRQFEELSDRGIGMALREDRLASYMPPEELIAERMHTASDSTRAHVRGAFVKWFHTYPNDIRARANWSSIEVGRLNGKIRIDDLRQTDIPDFEMLLKNAAA